MIEQTESRFLMTRAQHRKRASAYGRNVPFGDLSVFGKKRPRFVGLKETRPVGRGLDTIPEGYLGTNTGFAYN